MTSELAVGPLSRGSTRVMSRFAAPERRRTFWVALWVAAAAAEFGALAPVLFQHVPVQPIDVVFRLVGGSFVACGLIAWHRRPDNHSGLLMTATGFAFFVSPLLTQIDSPLPQTLALVFPDLWLLFFVPLLLTFLTAGRLRYPSGPDTRRGGPLRGAGPRPAVPDVLRRRRCHPPARPPRPADRRDRRHRPAVVVPRRHRRHRRRARGTVASGVGARPPRDAAQRGRGRVPAAPHPAAGRRPRRGPPTIPGAAVDHGLLAGHRPAGVPHGSAPLAAGPRWARRPVPGAADDATGRAAGRAGAGPARPGVRDPLPRPRRHRGRRRGPPRRAARPG